jgi:hypothetical protein
MERKNEPAAADRARSSPEDLARLRRKAAALRAEVESALAVFASPTYKMERPGRPAPNGPGAR